MSFGGHFPPVRRLGLAGELEVPLSLQLLRHWETYSDPGEPKHVELYGPGVFSHMVDEPDVVFEFADLDGFLALQVASDASCILMAHRDGLLVPPGTVLDVENLLPRATARSRTGSRPRWACTPLHWSADDPPGAVTLRQMPCV
jgi:hypothetical protein